MQSQHLGPGDRRVRKEPKAIVGYIMPYMTELHETLSQEKKNWQTKAVEQRGSRSNITEARHE